MARQFDGMQIEGAATLKLPSVARFGEWTGAAIAADPLIGAASIAGDVSWAAATLNIANAAIDLDGNAGEGVLTASLVDGKPSVRGTLDFAQFDLSPYLDALSAMLDPSGAWRGDAVRLPLLETADVDLRLSAGQAVADGAEVGPVAASLLVKEGALSVEVGEAHFGEGTIEASLNADMDGGVLSGNASLKLDDVPAQAAAGLFGVAGLHGTGEMTADLSAAGATWGDLIASLAGSASLSLTDGTIEGVDLSRLPEMIADPSDEAAGGSTNFTLAACTLAVADGVATTRDFRVEGAGFALNLAGKAQLAEHTVEARGVLALHGETPRDVPFLIDGAWDAPRVQPDLGGTLPRDAGERAGASIPSNG